SAITDDAVTHSQRTYECSTGYHQTSPMSPKKKSKGKIALGVVGGFVVLSIVGSALGGNTENAEIEATSQPAQMTGAASENAEEPATETAVETEASPSAEPEEETLPSAEPEETIKPKEYKGRGAKVLRINETDEMMILALTHKGSANFIVSTVSPEGEENDFPVNEIGNYKGTVVINSDQQTTAALKIQADGSWTATLKPISTARDWKGSSVSGTGAEVIGLNPASDGLTTMKATHSGQANFIVRTFGENPDFPINEIRKYSGEVLLSDGTDLVVIQTDGKWTLTKE
ncbi:hypothetical protein ACFOWE_24340, partial [Planomonospora corallina]